MFLKKYKIIRLDRVSSTNLYASALLSENKSDDACIIVADFQTTGKGHGSNSWESDAGLNLLISLVVFPANIYADEQFYLSKITAISIRELIAGRTGLPEIMIKWPNDVLAGNKKIAGILIENTLEGNNIRSSIIGAGINVNQTRFTKFPVPATSIKCISGKNISLELLLEEFTDIFDHWFALLDERDFNRIDTHYFRYLHGFQKLVAFSKEGSVFEAKIVHVERNGWIVLQMKDKSIRKFGFKDVQFVIH